MLLKYRCCLHDSPARHVNWIVTFAGDVIEDGALGTAAQLGRDAVQADEEEPAVLLVQVGRVVVPVAVSVGGVRGVQGTGEGADLCTAKQGRSGRSWSELSGHRAGRPKLESRRQCIRAAK